MIERNDAEGYSAAYLTAEWEPTDAASAAIVKLVYDDGRVMFLTDPDVYPPGVSDQPEPDDSEEHQHDGAAWAKHRIRTGQRKTLRVHGHTMATWARNVAGVDAQNIHTAISVGLTAGEENTDIAHRVIGSRRLNGVNGATETTRQQIFRLGRGLLAKRKNLMRGRPPE